MAHLISPIRTYFSSSNISNFISNDRSVIRAHNIPEHRIHLAIHKEDTLLSYTCRLHRQISMFFFVILFLLFSAVLFVWHFGERRASFLYRERFACPNRIVLISICLNLHTYLFREIKLNESVRNRYSSNLELNRRFQSGGSFNVR